MHEPAQAPETLHVSARLVKESRYQARDALMAKKGETPLAWFIGFTRTRNVTVPMRIGHELADRRSPVAVPVVSNKFTRLTCASCCMNAPFFLVNYRKP